jgi:hypothetical protein
MVISPKERKLLHRILQQIQAKADYSDTTFNRIYAYIWIGDTPNPRPRDRHLQESMIYLSTLIEERGFKTMKEAWSYLLYKRRRARAWLRKMMARVDREKFIKDMMNRLGRKRMGVAV